MEAKPIKIKILFTIPNFDTAGSGKALLNIALRLDREKFEDMRINSGLSKKFSSFIIAGLIGHRIISTIHLKYIHNKKVPKVGYTFSKDGSRLVKFIWNF